MRGLSPLLLYRSLASIRVSFIEKNGVARSVKADVGKSILDVAHANDVDLEGACDGACACSTCHVVLEKNVYDDLPAATEEEEDMLDLAFGLTETSRLGCQVKLEEKHDGISIRLPSATRNLYVDGHVPKPH